jgi:hypothetical protein
VLVPILRAIHRAALKGNQRQDEHFVLASIAADSPRFEFVSVQPETENHERITQMCDQFSVAWERNFGPVRDRAALPDALIALWRVWPKGGGDRTGYVSALRTLWRILRGSELAMQTNAIHQMAREYRPKRNL